MECFSNYYLHFDKPLSFIFLVMILYGYIAPKNNKFIIFVNAVKSTLN